MSNTLTLQPDDRELIRLLGGTFLLLDGSQVRELFPNRSSRAFRARMARLVRAGYLHVRYPAGLFRSVHPLYYLGAAGQKLLDPTGSNPKIASRLKQARNFSDVALMHLYLATWVQIKFMTGGHSQPDYELITWIPQYAPLWMVLNGHGLAVRPDGFVRYSRNGRVLHAFVEVDRNTYRSQLNKKFEGYHRYAQSGRSADHLKAPHFRVLVITDSKSRVKGLVRVASRYSGDLFWITTVDEFLSKPLFEPCWTLPFSGGLHALDEPTEPLPESPDPPYAFP